MTSMSRVVQSMTVGEKMCAWTAPVTHHARHINLTMDDRHRSMYMICMA